MEESQKNYTFSFESGTTQDDMIEYAEIMRERLTGKVSEDDLEHFISEYISSISNVVFLCDNCRETIPHQTNNSCKMCGLKFDLCEYCQQNVSLVKCPWNFGCQKSQDASDENRIFIPKNTDKPLERYNAFGETYVASESNSVNVYGKELIAGFENCDHYLSSAIYIPEKEVSHKLLEDLWLYFRTMDPQAVEKYGKPPCPVVELSSWKLYQTYQEFSECFGRFISVDDQEEGNETPLMMRIVYPNGDTFIVKRLYGEMQTRIGSIFSTFFIRLSDYLNVSDGKIQDVSDGKIQDVSEEKMKTDYNIECFRENIEKKTNKTVEELNEIGQVLLIAFSIGKIDE